MVRESGLWIECAPRGTGSVSSSGAHRRAADPVPPDVDRGHNAPGTPILEVDSARAAFEAELMDQAPYHLDQIRRE